MNSQRLTTLVRSSSLAGWAQRPPYYYSKARRSLEEFDRLDEDARRAVQDTLLKSVLRACRKVPAYSNLAGSRGRIEDFAYLTKADIRDREHLFRRKGLPTLGLVAQTGGSTGLPLSVVRSMNSIVFEQATIDHVARHAGADLATARIAVLRGDTIKHPNDMAPPFWRHASPRKLVLSAHHLGRSTIGHYADVLRDFSPDVIMAYPSSIDHLVELAAWAGTKIATSLVITSSERVPDGLRARILEGLGARMLDYYGQAERVSFAWSIQDNLYWMRGDYGLVEFEPSDAGLYDAYATGLHNLLFPLVRYDAGDLFDLGENLDTAHLRRIGLGCEPFRGIGGRTAEFVRLADGRRIIGLNHIPRGVPGILSVQLVQEEFDHLTAIVVPAADFGPASLDVLRANIRTKIPEAITVDIVTREAPMRLPSGKAPLFISKIGSA